MLKTLILVLIVLKMDVTVSYMESPLNGVQLRCLPKEVCFVK